MLLQLMFISSRRKLPPIGILWHSVHCDSLMPRCPDVKLPLDVDEAKHNKHERSAGPTERNEGDGVRILEQLGIMDIYRMSGHEYSANHEKYVCHLIRSGFILRGCRVLTMESKNTHPLQRHVPENRNGVTRNVTKELTIPAIQVPCQGAVL